jgi:CheY-like chemotaxis protein
MPGVLVVEDEPRVRAAAVEIFEDLGATVFDAYNAARALTLLAEHPEIALLFTDIRLPTVDGVELASMAVMRRPDLRVILTSGYGRKLAHPSWSFMPKPWSLGMVREVVEAALASRR